MEQKKTKKGMSRFVKVLIILFFLLIALVIWYSIHMHYEPEVHSSKMVAEMSLSGYAQSAPEDASVVYMIKDISPQSLVEIYKMLGVEPDGNVAVKISTGEAGGHNYLKPELIRDLVQEVDGTIVECNVAYTYGARHTTELHMQTAKEHGFTDIADVDIMDAGGTMEIPVTGGKHLKSNQVGANLANYDFVVTLSHFKGHPMAGFGGALKNISIGIASPGGKARIHTAGLTSNPTLGIDLSLFVVVNQNDALESMAEAAKSVSDYEDHGQRMLYINVLNNISVDCDCLTNPDEPDMHDIGILASLDPVAIDQASVDLIYAAEDGQSVQKRIESRNGLHIITHAEEIGLGSRNYVLVHIDEE